MKKLILRRFTLLVPLAALVVIAGCEIAVDFDRTKIPTDDADATLPDGGGDEDVVVPQDADNGDTGTTDAGDAGSDADAHVR